MDERLVVVLRGLGGAARTAELKDAGIGRAALRRAVDSGELVRHGRGCLAVPGTDAALVAAARVRGAVTCVSALDLLDLPLLARSFVPHVAIDAHRGAPRPGLVPASTVLHWSANVPIGHGTPRVATVAAALAHAAQCLPLAEVVAAIDAALRRRLVSPVDLRAARPCVGGPGFDRAVALADARAESIQESIARVALVQAGLRVRTQVVIRGVGRVDLLVEGVVVVELDGFAYHGDRSAFREDRRRDRAVNGRGLRVLRFTFEDVIHGVESLVEEVAAVVRAEIAARRTAPSVRSAASPPGRSRSWGIAREQRSAPTVDARANAQGGPRGP